MLIINKSTAFKGSFKKILKQGKDIGKLKKIIELLAHQEPLPEKYKDHKLSGPYKSYRDCHIEPDWILIYRVDQKNLFLELTGSHSELF